MTSSASIKGMPARTNADSCREKCISSSCLSFFFVISNWRTLRLSRSCLTSRPRSTSEAIAVFTEVAVATPEVFLPSSVTAWYLNLLIRSSDHVDVPEDLRDGRHVVGDQLDATVTQCSHPLSYCQVLDLVVPRLASDQLPHLLGDGQQFVYADPVLESGAEAEVASLAVPELLLLGAAHAPVELDLFDGWLEGDAAVPADPSHQPLTDDPDHRGSDQEGLDAEVQEPLQRAGRIGSVEGRQDQVSRECRLDPDASRLGVAHLADEDDVRVLTEDPLQSAGERDARLVVDLDLVDRGQDVFDRVLDRHDVALAVVDLGERRVQGRRLTASRRPRADHHPEQGADQS